MNRCLIVTSLAAEFAAEIERLGKSQIPVTACATAAEALSAYDGETVLFGNPQQIAEILPKLPAVAWVQSSWAGVTPLIRAGRRDYVLTGVRDVFGPQMSEYVFGYLLAHELRILERMSRQRARIWYREHSGVLAGKTLGLMGTGSIGRHLARTGHAFGMKALGLSRSGSAVKDFDEVLPASKLRGFLASCDHLVSTLPETPGTDRLLNAGTLRLLPRTAYFVNVGRSNVVDDAALMSALRRGRLAGAALDVFDEEPVPDDSPLWTTPNLSITAHIAAISHPLLIVPIFVDNYRRYVAGKPLRHVVDFDAGY
ncbi:MAG: D-2-hydroxyacid dehydrogenase [Gammaproteobacteria bacterium]|nr:D-2-hydroxyacid dehydrogenase [Gammaproteobacteria bacterium]